MMDKSHNVNPEHWGDEYWHNRNTEYMVLMNCVKYHRRPENLGMCTKYSDLKLLNVIILNE